ncbi:hypothetical protein NO989_19610 [Alteromonas sp. DY56-G5]|jgi:hypothetical protein|uniref:Uncharacterized protein n=1 Tax=Alteromonas mediterranea TaxID=314275 RepID=A0AAC8XNG2_9ALTE|nr:MULTISPECIES: hypothetical protein [Alteromonas]AFV87660.1 hypothetical protein amad1_21113 [Alteromonas mediterranea DE1]AGP87698.1 hypothetical protein I607_19817 [Alteromonas mediterranea U4]AGP99680.1 hypothetical protein I635_21109 [Alteromonas mediterranea UM7]AMJ80788.1 hypothetical protein AV942_20605 [Alteromonas mediterranea]AMJ84951.1 hypothetical protein AV941_20710 [Alteromonas mediterranea]|tara:strand:+ start:8858 stop:9499 length:642 start_codon:yes stop_codon:yes gene_type:complete
MSLVFHIEQLILSKNKKAKLYDGDFPYQNKQTGEIIQVHRKFYALNLAHAEKLSQHIKKLEHYKLERGNWKHAFGISHDQSTGKVLRFAQRISGTRNLKTNFNKGLNAGGIPLFAFTRHSYAMVLSTIKGNKSDISPDQLTVEEKDFLKKKMLAIFGLALCLFSMTVVFGVSLIINNNTFSLSGYGVLTTLALSLLFIVSSFKTYKEYDNVGK